MGYYLSDSNRKMVEPFIRALMDHLLRKRVNDFIIDTTVPERLAYLLRNAVNCDPYTDLRGKFRFKVKESKVVCSPTSLSIGTLASLPSNPVEVNELISNVETPTQIRVHDEVVGFFDIVQIISTESPSIILFQECNITPKEASKLENFAANMGYTLTDESDSLLERLKFTKNA